MTGKKMAIKTLPFDAAEYLTDEQAVADFLNASAQMGDSAVLLNALSAVARAQEGRPQCAQGGADARYGYSDGLSQ